MRCIPQRRPSSKHSQHFRTSFRHPDGMELKQLPTKYRLRVVPMQQTLCTCMSCTADKAFADGSPYIQTPTPHCR